MELLVLRKLTRAHFYNNTFSENIHKFISTSATEASCAAKHSFIQRDYTYALY
jgi:hypothetical protein